MSRLLLIVFFFFTYTFSQENSANNEIDSSTTKEANYDNLIGINLMHSNYTLGVEEDAHKGESFGLNFVYKLINHSYNEYTLNIGSLIINQRSARYCEHVGSIGNNFNQTVFYLKGDYSAFYKYFMYRLGVAFNTAGEENENCANEIYFHPLLLSYDIGLGLINLIFVNFGINTDYEINKSFGKNYSLFNMGINYILNERDYLRINYYWNRDNFVDRFYHGWLLKSHQSLFNRFGLNTKFYYSNDIKGFSLNLSLTYVL